MFTRSQYLNKEVTHNEYYAQFVTEGVINIVTRCIGKEAIINSTDEYYNDIPLKRWNALHSIILHTVGSAIAKASGTGGVSLSDTVCVAKAAAQQIKAGA